MKPFDQELVSGSVIRSIWKLAWPVMLTNLFNGLHGFIDHALVGHYVGSEANAGIGVAWQLFLVVVVFISSLFHGMNALIARYTGRQDRQSLGRIVYQTFLGSAVILVLIAAPVGFAASSRLLGLVTTDPTVRAHALPYIRVLFTCSAPLFLLFMLANAFQASGDPKTPLKLGVLTTALNAVLSLVLITGLGPVPALGAVGAALATCAAPVPAAIIALSFIYRRKTIIPPPERFTLVPDLSVLRVVARIGIPAGLQAVLLNVGGAALLKYMDLLEDGGRIQAAYTICYAQLFSFVTFAAFGLRASTAAVVGQNLGAGKSERARSAAYLAAAIGASWAAFMGVIYWFFPEALLSLFGVTQEPVLGFGRDLLRFLAFSGIMASAALAFTGALQGAGDTVRPLYISLFTQIVLLLGLCGALYLLGLLSARAIWACILIGHSARFLLSLAAFRQGRWSGIRVEIE